MQSSTLTTSLSTSLANEAADGGETCWVLHRGRGEHGVWQQSGGAEAAGTAAPAEHASPPQEQTHHVNHQERWSGEGCIHHCSGRRCRGSVACCQKVVWLILAHGSLLVRGSSLLEPKQLHCLSHATPQDSLTTFESDNCLEM